MCDLELPPKNKLRKIIFNEFTGLTTEEKLKIVGQIVGRSKKIHEDDIYQCMLDLHDLGKKITISRLAGSLDCSARTIHRNMSNELKKEKELLNKELWLQKQKIATLKEKKQLKVKKKYQTSQRVGDEDVQRNYKLNTESNW